MDLLSRQNMGGYIGIMEKNMETTIQGLGFGIHITESMLQVAASLFLHPSGFKAIHTYTRLHVGFHGIEGVKGGGGLCKP